MTLAVRAGPQGSTTPPVLCLSATHRFTRTFKGQLVRIARIDGKAWLCATDLCRALELPIGGTVTSAAHTRRLIASGDLDAADRAFTHLPTPQGDQRLAVLSVAGALALAKARSRPIDTEVTRWLNREFPDA